MASLASRYFVQIEWPLVIRTSARIWEVGETSLYMHIISECTYSGNMGRTGVGLVSRCDRLSSVILSPHFLQTTLAYTPDLERPAV